LTASLVYGNRFPDSGIQTNAIKTRLLNNALLQGENSAIFKVQRLDLPQNILKKIIDTKTHTQIPILVAFC
jgi:hypothetical protein